MSELVSLVAGTGTALSQLAAIGWERSEICGVNDRLLQHRTIAEIGGNGRLADLADLQFPRSTSPFGHSRRHA
jgi:hypothetical protein